VLLTTFANGRRVARHFDRYGVLKAFSPDHAAAADRDVLGELLVLLQK